MLLQIMVIMHNRADLIDFNDLDIYVKDSYEYPAKSFSRSLFIKKLLIK